MVEGDYGHAVVQVICLLYEGHYHLVFASAELIPSELPARPNEEGKSMPAKRVGDKARVFYKRYVTTASDALAWYERCRNGLFTLLQNEAQLPTRNEELFEEPSWPQLIVGTKFPVTGDVASSVRAHHMYPVAVPPLVQQLFTLHPEIQQWASDCIFSSFVRYPELAGSVHLLAPNPVYRGMTVRLNVGQDKTEGTAIELTPRAGMSPQGLEAIVVEHRPTGICAYQVHPFGTNPYVLVKHHGAIEEVEVLIRCAQRGLLEWQEPSSFIRSTSVDMSIVSARKKVIVPGPAGAVADEYEVSVSTLSSSNTHRAPGGPSVIPSLLRSRGFERERSDEAKRLGQKWFHGSKSEATEFVRSLIGAAKERVWIVDPYFATAELFSFALATSRESVEVVILTGASTALQKEDDIDTSVEAGEMLLQNLGAHSTMAHIKVFVMTGSMPTVHDRFLVIDNAVWFTGNSLNSLGERAGMMISVPAPAEVISKLDAILNDTQRTKSLKDWVAARVANRTT